MSNNPLLQPMLWKKNKLALSNINPMSPVSSTMRPSKMWLLGLAALGLVGCFDNSDSAADKAASEPPASTQVRANTEVQANTPANISTNVEGQTPPSLCHETWYQEVENELSTQDGHGHGPDLGSAEWRSVVEFKLNIRDNSALPKVESDDWCRYIDEHYLQVQD